MRHLLTAAAIILLLAAPAFASDPSTPAPQDCTIISNAPADPSTELPTELMAQRGCCSWHGGVCGCSNGRAQCCDGSLSPTCGCQTENVQPPS